MTNILLRTRLLFQHKRLSIVGPCGAFLPAPTPLVEAVHHHRWLIIDWYSLAHAGGIHLEEGVVHEEVESFLLPGSAGVLVPAEAAQQLDTGPVAGGVVSTTRGERRNVNNNFPFWFVLLVHVKSWLRENCIVKTMHIHLWLRR